MKSRIRQSAFSGFMLGLLLLSSLVSSPAEAQSVTSHSIGPSTASDPETSRQFRGLAGSAGGSYARVDPLPQLTESPRQAATGAGGGVQVVITGEEERFKGITRQQEQPGLPVWFWVASLTLAIPIALMVGVLLGRRGAQHAPEAYLAAGPARHPLLASANVVGRSRGCGVRPESPCVSRNHARIWRGSPGWIVEDLASGNGTFVNGERLKEPHPLLTGDEIVFADWGAVFEVPGMAPPRTRAGRPASEAGSEHQGR